MTPMESGDARGEATRLLAAVEAGETGAADALLDVLYQDLRRIAAGYMGGERTGHTREPTALVHEAWMRVSPDGGSEGFEGRAHFVLEDDRGIARVVSVPLFDQAQVRSALGTELRPRVLLRLRLLGVEKRVPVALRDRSHMEYRLLVGRDFLADDFVVDVSRANGDRN